MNKIYEVSRIVGRRVKKGKVEYRVRWKDFPPEEDTWELSTNLRETCVLLIREFNSQARHKKELYPHPTTMTAYSSHSISPHSSPPLKKTALSECSSDQLSVMSATNCSPRSVSPSLTASITPPITTPVKSSDSHHSSSIQNRTNVSKGTKRSPGKGSLGSPSPVGGRKKVMVVFNATDGDLSPPSSPSDVKASFERKRDYNTLDAAAKVTSKALTHRPPSVQSSKQQPSSTSSKQKETGGSFSGGAKDKRPTAQEAVSASDQMHSGKLKKSAHTKEAVSAGKAAAAKPTVRRKYVRKKPLKSEKQKTGAKADKKTKKDVSEKGKGKRENAGKAGSDKRSMKSGKKTKEYIKLKSKSLYKVDKKKMKSPLSPRSFKNYEPPMHQKQIEAAASHDTRNIPVLVVYALDKIKKMKRKGDVENIHDVVKRMASGFSVKKSVVEKNIEAMEKNFQLLRWEGGGGCSFRVSSRAIEALHIDNSDRYLSVAPDKHLVNLTQRSFSQGLEAKAGKSKKGEAAAKKRKMPSGVDPVLLPSLTKRRKMLEETSEVSGSSASLPPTDAPISKEGRSGKDSTHSSAGSTSSGTSQSLVNKACNLIENIQNKSKTNAHVYTVGRHVLLVPPSGSNGPDMSKQMSTLPHKRFAGGARDGANGVAGPPQTGSTAVVPPQAGGVQYYPIERRISVRQTESAYKFKDILVRKHDGFVEIAIQSNSGTMKNVFTMTALSELQQALQSAIHDCDSRLLLLTGSDRAFSHGIDLNYVSHLRSNDATARYTESLRAFLVSLASFPKPVVAAVNGPAIGLGAALLPLCDIVYASDKAHLQLPYCHLGQTPEGGSSFTLPHLVGSAIASDMFMSGRKLTASEACDRGLVSEVFWPSVLMQQVIPRCRRIAQCPPLSLESTKCIIRSQMREQLIYAIESECSMLTECWENNECKRKIQEFLNSKVDSIL